MIMHAPSIAVVALVCLGLTNAATVINRSNERRLRTHSDSVIAEAEFFKLKAMESIDGINPATGKTPKSTKGVLNATPTGTETTRGTNRGDESSTSKDGSAAASKSSKGSQNKSGSSSTAKHSGPSSGSASYSSKSKKDAVSSKHGKESDARSSSSSTSSTGKHSDSSLGSASVSSKSMKVSVSSKHGKESDARSSSASTSSTGKHSDSSLGSASASSTSKKESASSKHGKESVQKTSSSSTSSTGKHSDSHSGQATSFDKKSSSTSSRGKGSGTGKGSKSSSATSSHGKGYVSTGKGSKSGKGSNSSKRSQKHDECKGKVTGKGAHFGCESSESSSTAVPSSADPSTTREPATAPTTPPISTPTLAPVVVVTIPPSPDDVTYTLPLYYLFYDIVQTRIPTFDDYSGLATFTAEYLAVYFQVIFGETPNVDFVSSTSEVVGSDFRLGQPVRVDYNTTMTFTGTSEALEEQMLLVLLTSAFEGTNGDRFATAVAAALDETNTFSTTSSISFSEAPTTRSLTGKAGFAAGAAVAAFAMLLFGGSVYKGQTKSRTTRDPTKCNLMEHMTDAGETWGDETNSRLTSTNSIVSQFDGHPSVAPATVEWVETENDAMPPSSNGTRFQIVRPMEVHDCTEYYDSSSDGSADESSMGMHDAMM